MKDLKGDVKFYEEIHGVKLRPNAELAIERLGIPPTTTSRICCISGFLNEPKWVKLFKGYFLFLCIFVGIGVILEGINLIRSGNLLGIERFSLSIFVIIFAISILFEKEKHLLTWLPLTDEWEEFLNKFCMKTKEGWRIEYGLLSSAWQLYKRNPEEFKKLASLARDKEEFKVLLGIS